MNLTEFLNQVNQRTQAMGQKQLSASILDLARTIYKCVDVGWIAEGYELVKKIVDLEIVIEGVYREYSFDDECYPHMNNMVELEWQLYESEAGSLYTLVKCLRYPERWW